MTTCPETQKPVHTGHHATATQFAQASYEGARFRCAACDQIHGWEKADAWIALSRAPVPA